jgi:hypothetical protein
LINISKVAEALVVKYNLTRAQKYDLVLRDYDNMVELIGLIDDPTLDIRDFQNREMLFPKRWVTLAVFPETEGVPS